MTTISLTTDFGLQDWFVGTMKGVIQRIAPGATVIDISHGIRQGDIRQGAFMISQALPWFPSDAVHVGVVDPGVGSSRRAVVIETDGPVLVGPDNGLFIPALRTLTVRGVWSIANREWISPEVSSTFHGRDIFAPAAARIAGGAHPSEAGPELTGLQSLELPEPERHGKAVIARVLHVDHFGNLITSMDTRLFPAESLNELEPELPWGTEKRPEYAGIKSCYHDIPDGQFGLIAGSTGFWELAMNCRSLAGFCRQDPDQPLPFRP